MYRLRTTFLNNAERSRQKKMQRVAFGEMPYDRVGKLTAAILNTSRVNTIRAFKIEKQLEQIQAIIGPDNTDENSIFSKRREILNAIADTKFQIGDVFQLSYKPKIQALYPEPNKQNFVQWSVLPNTKVSLVDFEHMLFNSKVIIRYYENVKFIDYIVGNLKYYLDVDNVEETRDNALMQAKLLQFIDKTGYNEFSLTKAFYENRIAYDGVIYDTQFVPKYPVLDLKHQLTPLITTNNTDEIDYWHSIDLSTIAKVPLQYLSIFMAFPFKNGFYVQPNGSIIKIPLKPKKRTSLINTLGSICSVDDLAAVLDQTSQLYAVEDVLHWTIYEKTLRNVGLGILLLRRYYGNILSINPYKIALATEHNILSWLSFQCSGADTSPGLILPLGIDDEKNTTTRTAEISVNLIRDIVASCQTAFGAAVLCSNYCLLEIDMHSIYKQLVSPTEKYVFLMLVFQYYPYYTYYKALKSIRSNLIFGTDPSLDVLSLYKPNVRAYKNASLNEKLDQMTVPIVRPQDLNANVNACPPNTCPDLYEYADPQLDTLAKHATVVFQSPKQLANFIDLCI